MATNSCSSDCLEFLTRCFQNHSQSSQTDRHCCEQCISEGQSTSTKEDEFESKSEWKNKKLCELVWSEMKATDGFLQELTTFKSHVDEILTKCTVDAETLRSFNKDLSCYSADYSQLNKQLHKTGTNAKFAEKTYTFIVYIKEEHLNQSFQLLLQNLRTKVLPDDFVAAKDIFVMLIDDQYQKIKPRQSEQKHDIDDQSGSMQQISESTPQFPESLEECAYHRNNTLKTYCPFAKKNRLCCSTCVSEKHRECKEKHLSITNAAEKITSKTDRNCVKKSTERIQAYAKNIAVAVQHVSKEWQITRDLEHKMRTIGSEIENTITEYDEDYEALRQLGAGTDYIRYQSETIQYNWKESFLQTINVTRMKRDFFRAKYEGCQLIYDEFMYQPHTQKQFKQSGKSEGDKHRSKVWQFILDMCKPEIPIQRGPSQPHDSTNPSWSMQEKNEYLQFRIQKQAEKQRQVEASKQMLYGVFGNFISILEELESRITGNKNMSKSKISIADQSYKSNEDVQGIVQGQLLSFQMQTKACPSDVRIAVNKELRMKTIMWIAVREANDIDDNEVDEYVCQLYEILVTQRTDHKEIDQRNTHVSADVMRETLPKLFQGKHEAKVVTDTFDTDRSKKAHSPETRESSAKNALQMGTARMKRIRPDLKNFLNEDFSPMDIR